MSVNDMPSKEEAARLLTGELGPDGVISCPGPGHSVRDRSLRVWLTDEGPRVHPFAGDDPMACLDYVRERLGLAEWRPSERTRVWPAQPPRSPPAEVDEDAARRCEVARWLWTRRRPIAGSPAEAYVRMRIPTLAALPATIGFLPADQPNYMWPTMIAAFGIPSEPHPGELRIEGAAVVGVHLTYLALDGSGKAPITPAKRMIGRGHSAPIVLAPMGDNLGLIVAEGIEDALTLHAETGLGAWAAGCANRLPDLAKHVPAFTDHVTIVADDDDAGRRGAASLRDAIRARGISADILDMRRCRRDAH